MPVDVGHSGVGGREAMRVHVAVHVARVIRFDKRHVAIRTVRRLRRIVERPRSLPRDAACLPRIVFVEAANPAVVVHRHVKMHLVARRTKLGAVLPHERLYEGSAVGGRRGVDDVAVDGANDGIPARHQRMQGRILDREPTVAHRVRDARNRMARNAPQPGLRLGRVDLPDGGFLEPAVEEHGVVVAAGAPLRSFDAGGLLHVLDGLAIELVVERREVVHRFVPLLVDVLVALTAEFRIKEEIRRDVASRIGLRGRREERASHASAFVLHRPGRFQRVHDAVLGRREPVTPKRHVERQAQRQHARPADPRRKCPGVTDRPPRQ